MFALACLCLGMLEAQPVSIGVKGGVPITDAFETFHGNDAFYFTNTKRYVVGPTVQVNLPLRFSVEVDALYRRLGFEYLQTSPGSVRAAVVANSWEFPLLIKFDILPGPVRPFVDTGASFRNISGIDSVRHTVNAAGQVIDTSLSNAPEFNKRNDVGFVFGGGVEFKLGWLRISPEFRYTRWGSENFRDPINSFLRTNRNQGDFIIGLTF
jgi:opacity protein-like surface antigen